MSMEELRKFQIQNLEGYVSFLKTKKLSRGLTDHEIRLYEEKKAELKSLTSSAGNVKQLSLNSNKSVLPA